MSAHAQHSGHGGGPSLNRTAALATLHCLTGCAIGEVLGMVIGTAAGFSNAATIALAVVLAFFFGYSLTMLPLVRAGLALGVAVPLAFASDSFSIAVMEIVDNGVMLSVPGAMDAPLSDPLFWGALAFALAVAYVFAFPLNRYLIARGLGHAVVHEYHHGGGGHHAAHGHGAPAAAAGPGSPRTLVLVGIAAVAVTVAVTTGAAIYVEGDESGGHAMSRSDEPAREDAHGGTATHAGGDAAADELSGLAVADNGYRLDVAETVLAPGRPAEFTFSITDDGGTVRDFEEHGGVRMHLIVVRRDLAGYQHLHPTIAADGSWRTRLTLPSGGVYRAYADFERNGEKTVLATDLFAAGEFAPAELPAPANDVSAGGYRVRLDAEAEAGSEATLTYRITRAGRPVDVEPYLGAAGHLVALRQGDLAYLHVHPLAENAGEVSFAAEFPTPGNYRLFLQFKDAGRVYTAPLTLHVSR